MRRAASRLSLLIFEPVRSTDHPSICPAASFTRGEPFDDSLCICRAAINNEPLLAWVSVQDPWKKEREEYTCREVYSRCVHCWSCAKRMRVNYILLLLFVLSSFFIFLSSFRTKDLRFFSLLKMKTLRIAARSMAISRWWSAGDRIFRSNNYLIEKNFEKENVRWRTFCVITYPIADRFLPDTFPLVIRSYILLMKKRNPYWFFIVQSNHPSFASLDPI